MNHPWDWVVMVAAVLFVGYTAFELFLSAPDLSGKIAGGIFTVISVIGAAVMSYWTVRAWND